MIPETKNMAWPDVAKAMQQHLEDSIAAVQPEVPARPAKLPLNVTTVPRELFPKDVVTLTESPTEVLLSQLSSGKITSRSLTTAFLQRAGLASRLVNCVTELLPERALKRADYLDAYFKKHGKVVGPLHGLPISVKDMVGMEGLDLNSGFVSWVGRPTPKADALILQFLSNAGAVFYARTTQPQTLMHLETSNDLYGITVNPHNTKLTSGGSTGGEGALLGIKGSCLGIGTDIGGSIRVPAGNNGVFGLKPTSLRLPLIGGQATMAGQELMVPAIGPMSTSLDGLKVFMSAILDQQPWIVDPTLVNIPWKKESQLRVGQDGRRKLRVGVMSDDGQVGPHPPILRGINTIVEKLRKSADIEIVDFPPYRHDEAWGIASSLYFADGGADQRETIDASGEPWFPLSEWILKENPNVKELHVRETWKLILEKKQYKSAYLQHWNSVGTTNPGPNEPGSLDALRPLTNTQPLVDVILGPLGPGCAPPLHHAKYWGYSAQWNLLDCPGVAFPTGLRCGPEDKIDEAYSPRSEQDKWNHELYNPATYVDAPISLQLVGRRYEDEKLIEALGMITDAAGLAKS